MALDPVLIGILAVLVVFAFLSYLFLRRIAVGFREGFERGRDGS